jgi:hypothetical protein
MLKLLHVQRVAHTCVIGEVSKATCNLNVYISVSQTFFFKWGPLLLVRMFYGPPYSCPL